MTFAPQFPTNSLAPTIGGPSVAAQSALAPTSYPSNPQFQVLPGTPVTQQQPYVVPAAQVPAAYNVLAASQGQNPWTPANPAYAAAGVVSPVEARQQNATLVQQLQGTLTPTLPVLEVVRVPEPLPMGAHYGPDGFEHVFTVPANVTVVKDFSFMRGCFSTFIIGQHANGKRKQLSNWKWTGPQYSGLDIETEGVINPWDGEVATVQVELNNHVYVVHLDFPQTLLDVKDVEFFEAYLRENACTKIIHNSSFERKWFMKYFGEDLYMDSVHDSIAAEYILAQGYGFGEVTRMDFDASCIGLGSVIQRRYGQLMDKDPALRTSFRRKGFVERVEPEKDPVKNRVNICMFDGCNAPPTYLKGSGANTKQLCEAHLNDPAYKRLKKIEPMPPEPQATFRIHQDLSPRQVVYAAFDAMWMPRLAWDQLQELHAHRDRQGRTPWPYLFKLECDVAEAIARMELHGIPINRGQAMRTHIALLHEAKRLEHELITMLKDHPDEEVKLGSQVYMVPKLNARGIPLPNYRGAELKRHIDHEVIRKILRWKSVTKMMDFTLSFLTKVSAVTKRVHASFNQYQTSTSRLSSSGPNFQNIPSKAKESKELRACVDAEACEDNDPNDPWTFIICDLSNIEMRLLAEWTMDASMIDLFIRDKDAHCLTAARNMGVTYEEMYQRYKVDKIPEFVKARNNAKVPNFGLSYGAGWPKLKIMAWEQYGLVWSDAEAQTQRNGYFSTFPGVGGWHQRIKTDIKNGYGPYIVENSLGRVRVMPREVTMEEDGKIQRVSCYQRALNFPIQSNGAEIVKRAMVALMRQWQIVLQVHDELVVKCKKSQAEACLAAVVAAMEGAGAGILVHVPNKADGQISSKWKK